MAFWTRKPNRQGVPKYVVVYTMQDGKQSQIPRKRTKHLDTMEDFQIDHWVDQYTRQYERPKIHPDSLHFSDSRLAGYIHSFVQYRIVRRGRHAGTEEHMGRMMIQWVFPFFLQQNPPATDPNTWPGCSIRLLEYWESKQIALHTQRCMNTFLRKFWKWMTEENIIHTDIPLRLRTPVIAQQPTLLKLVVRPEDVLEYAQSPVVPELRILALLGYFCSLRPQESYGADRKDFRAGSGVTELECGKAMAKLGLWNRLAIKVDRQRDPRGKVTKPKTQISRGWVCCFDAQAAALLVGLIKERQGRIIDSYTPDYWTKRWRREGIKGVTLKDLRRASLYWLGHYTEMQALQLRRHARHSRFETTLLYLRTPEETLPEIDDLDMDA